MAVYPCDWSNHRYPDAQRSVYVTFAAENTVTTTMLRFCPKHFREESAKAHQLLSELEDGSMADALCTSCKANRACAIYVKLYDEHREVDHLVGDFCADCALVVMDQLQTSKGRGMKSSYGA
jgi:hypothetical protein